MACINHENINHKIYLTINNHYTVSTSHTHGFTAQLASYFVQDSLLDLWQKRDNILSV